MAVKREPVSFGNVQESGHEELGGASPLAVNVIVDGTGAVHRRPAAVPSDRFGGGSEQVSEESAIVALHSTAGGRLFAVDAPTPYSRIYEIDQGVVNLSSGDTSLIVGGRRPIIAETEAMLAIAAGNAIQKVLLTTPAASSRLGGGSPLASHVIAHGSRLLANDVRSTSLVHFSDQAAGDETAGHEDWTSDDAGFFSADARPDPVVGLHENTNEVFAFGTTNLQIFTRSDSAAITFAPSNAREFGCSAPYSVVRWDQSFGFVDNHRRIVLTDGREYQVISSDIQQTLDSIPDMSDAFGYRVTLGPVDALCWCVPSDGRTFAYQVSSKGWAIWQGWDDGTNNYRPWPVRCALRIPETGENLVGVEGVGVGFVYELSNATYQDAFGRIVARVDTGYIDRGTSGRKLCRALRLTWRGTPSTDTSAFVQWRDDAGPWEDPRPVEIGNSSEVILRSLGVYRRRQWRVIFSGSAQLVLVRAEEEFELLAV